jgi:hypothetical protein
MSSALSVTAFLALARSTALYLAFAALSASTFFLFAASVSSSYLALMELTKSSWAVKPRSIFLLSSINFVELLLQGWSKKELVELTSSRILILLFKEFQFFSNSVFSDLGILEVLLDLIIVCLFLLSVSDFLSC